MPQVRSFAGFFFFFFCLLQNPQCCELESPFQKHWQLGKLRLERRLAWVLWHNKWGHVLKRKVGRGNHSRLYIKENYPPFSTSNNTGRKKKAPKCWFECSRCPHKHNPGLALGSTWIHPVLTYQQSCNLSSTDTDRVGNSACLLTFWPGKVSVKEKVVDITSFHRRLTLQAGRTSQKKSCLCRKSMCFGWVIFAARVNSRDSEVGKVCFIKTSPTMSLDQSNEKKTHCVYG